MEINYSAGIGEYHAHCCGVSIWHAPHANEITVALSDMGNVNLEQLIELFNYVNDATPFTMSLGRRGYTLYNGVYTATLPLPQGEGVFSYRLEADKAYSVADDGSKTPLKIAL